MAMGRCERKTTRRWVDRLGEIIVIRNMELHSEKEE
jgi:hypothetical protein